MSLNKQINFYKDKICLFYNSDAKTGTMGHQQKEKCAENAYARAHMATNSRLHANLMKITTRSDAIVTSATLVRNARFAK